MDLKTHIMRWQYAIEQNSAIALLAIFIAVAAVFILALIIDAVLKRRRDKKRLRK